MRTSVKGSVRARLVAIIGATMLLLTLAGAPASAQQTGLVNVAVDDVVLQVPVAVAANLCDINVNALAVQLREGGAECDAKASSDAVFDPGSPDEDDDAPPAQSGLVNVIIDDVTVQVPIAIAANICDVNVNFLALQARSGGAECTADADAAAESV